MNMVIVILPQRIVLRQRAGEEERSEWTKGGDDSDFRDVAFEDVAFDANMCYMLQTYY